MQSQFPREHEWIVFACSLFNTLYFLARDPSLVTRRLSAGPGAERERSQKRIQAMAGILLCALIVLPGFDWRLYGASVPQEVVLAADVVLLSGLLIVFLAFRANSYAASTVQVEARQPTVSTGPYAWVRHPMYSGSILAFFATPCALDSPWAFVPAALLCAVVVARLLDEERYPVGTFAGLSRILQQGALPPDPVSVVTQQEILRRSCQGWREAIAYGAVVAQLEQSRSNRATTDIQRNP
ncbi:MAG: hypothetical protein JWN23_3465 [Rhodocyclales bacterium]|nr:hypothetical protein [Rhodocyclales bacterium]